MTIVEATIAIRPVNSKIGKMWKHAINYSGHMNYILLFYLLLIIFLSFFAFKYMPHQSFMYLMAPKLSAGLLFVFLYFSLWNVFSYLQMKRLIAYIGDLENKPFLAGFAKYMTPGRDDVYKLRALAVKSSKGTLDPKADWKDYCFAIKALETYLNHMSSHEEFRKIFQDVYPYVLEPAEKE